MSLKVPAWKTVALALIGAILTTPVRAIDEEKAPLPAAKDIPRTLDDVHAQAYLLVDGDTGVVLCERNPDERHLPASTVKLMTALVTYENIGFKGSITITPDDEAEESNVPVVPGETISVDVLLHALLIDSDNDAARALARKVAVTNEAFVALMNKRAKDLGCNNTHYANPNGLPVPNEDYLEYSTCRDLMKIFLKAISYPDLYTICSTKNYSLHTKAGKRELVNHNRLLGNYPGMGPAKTGYTDASLGTYAAKVERIVHGKKHVLLLTLMDAPHKFEDIPILLDYGFAILEPIPLGPPVPLKLIKPTPTPKPTPVPVD
jgi:D-alanyl-D-alanine carboxypeptidase